MGEYQAAKGQRDMNIGYFFVGDIQKGQHIAIEYCPTGEMIGNFFTKPLGVATFCRFHSIIMNGSHDKYGSVNVDELMAIHNKKLKKSSTWYWKDQ